MINCCLQEEETEFCSEILDTRVSILDELSSRQQTPFWLQSNGAEKNPVCHLLRMGLQGLSDLLQDPAHNRDEHNSPAVFRLTIVLFGRMRQLHWHRGGGASAGLPGNKAWLNLCDSSSPSVALSTGNYLRAHIPVTSFWNVNDVFCGLPCNHGDGR